LGRTVKDVTNRKMFEMKLRELTLIQYKFLPSRLSSPALNVDIYNKYFLDFCDFAARLLNLRTERIYLNNITTTKTVDWIRRKGDVTNVSKCF
jgi:hypothetical protein